jgi:hypothetical protein
MKTLNEVEIAKKYEGKPYITEKLRKIAMGSGNTRAVLYNYRITKSQGALIGITDEIFYKWCEDDIYFFVYIDLDEISGTIKHCSINKSDGDHIKLSPTQQELEIFQNVMIFITESKE